MRMWLKIGALVVGVVLIGVVGGAVAAAIWVVATDTDADPPAAGVAMPTDQARPTESRSVSIPALTPSPPFAPIAINGVGSRTTPLPEISQGIAVITMRHEGEGSFEARLELAGDGTDSGPSRPLASGAGDWSASRAVAILDGQRPSLTVAADGPWEIAITRPTPDDAEVHTLPYEVSGSGSQAVYFLNVPQGEHTITATHDGQHDFIVVTMNQYGQQRRRPIDTRGAYADTVSFGVPSFPNAFLVLDVRATGNWTIKVE